MEFTAFKSYMDLVTGIMTLVNAADIYTVHLLSNHRKVPVSLDLIESILEENNISGFTLVGEAYTKEDISMLDKTDRLRRIGEQIVLATYTAVEVYLIDKFKEYYSFRTIELAPSFVESTLTRFSFRDLREINKHYYEVLGIHLPSFDIDFHSSKLSNFQPPDSWAALNLLAQARNEIAHHGKSKSYRVTTLMDSWLPFELARGWVAHFNLNFDKMIYDGQESELIKEYKKTLATLEQSKQSKMV